MLLIQLFGRNSYFSKWQSITFIMRTCNCQVTKLPTIKCITFIMRTCNYQVTINEATDNKNVLLLLCARLIAK